MNIANRTTHEDEDYFLSRHSSNPFDDNDSSAKRILGLGSSELSDCETSDLGGYKGPVLEHPLETGFGTVVEVEDEDSIDHAMDEDDLQNIPGIMDTDFDSDSSNSEYIKERASLYFRCKEEREEIEEEIEDLLQAVPALKEDYYLLDRLGTGTFSSVYKAIDLRYDEWDNTPWQGINEIGLNGLPFQPESRRKPLVAIKRIYATSMPDRIRNEISILEDLLGCRHVSQIMTAFREEDQVVIVMPYQRSEDFRDYHLTLPISGVKDYMRCLFRGLRDIHSRGIIHRDIKPANFLFDPKTGTGTIVDLGLACRMSYDEVSTCNHTAPSENYPHGKIKNLDDIPVSVLREAKSQARSRSKWSADRVGYPENDTRPQSKANRAGTRGFRAPEVLLKCTSQSGAVDIWSAGTILLFFLTGKFPIFHCPNDTEALVELAVLLGRKAVERTALLHNRTVITNLPSIEFEPRELRDLVRRLNPGLFVQRIPGEDMVATRRRECDVENAINLLKATLEPESIKRITARDALYHPFLTDHDQPEDDELFPHPWGRGVCGEYHEVCETTEELRLWYENEPYTVKAGQFVAIGNKPCEFHKHLPEYL